jgi:hypothetical protein
MYDNLMSLEIVINLNANICRGIRLYIYIYIYLQNQYIFSNNIKNKI